MIVLCGNCGFENSPSPTEKDEGSCTKDRMTCCKKKKKKSRQKREGLPPPPHHTHRHLHHRRTTPGSQVRLVDKGRRRLAYDSLASRPPLIIHLIIQSETLGTRLRILHGSSLSASLTLSLLPPPPPAARSPPSFSNPPIPSQRRLRRTDERTPLYLFGSAPLLVQVERDKLMLR